MDSIYKKEVAEIAYSVFGIKVENLDMTLSPIDYDFDSVKVVKFVRKVNAHFEIEVKMSKVFSVDDFEELFALFENSITSKAV